MVLVLVNYTNPDVHELSLLSLHEFMKKKRLLLNCIFSFNRLVWFTKPVWMKGIETALTAVNKCSSLWASVLWDLVDHLRSVWSPSVPLSCHLPPSGHLQTPRARLAQPSYPPVWTHNTHKMRDGGKRETFKEKRVYFFPQVPLVEALHPPRLSHKCTFIYQQHLKIEKS